jgi:penicillin amidase
MPSGAATIPRFLLRLLLGRRLPATSGSLAVAGLRQGLTIRRDAWGIPHIDAQTEDDAWFGLGFCHGQDRAFQLEFVLRIVRGTLAELVGAPGLPLDRLTRRIGFVHAARRQWPVLAPEVRAMVEAYVRGVGAGATAGLRRRPHEFVLLRSRPTPWTPLDVLGALKLQAFALGANWDMELARLKVLTADGPEALAALDPAYPEWHPVSRPVGACAGPALDRLAEDLEAFAEAARLGGGSNNWAIGAGRTAAGRPLLANDLHLPPLLPSPWYLAHVRTPDWAAAGASCVGGPCIAVGHNGFAAWGVTSGYTDNADLFLEEIGPDGRSVRQGDAFVPCPVRREEIAVRGGATVVEEVLETPHGPVIGPAVDAEAPAISLRATWLDPLPVQGLLRMHRVRGFAEARRVLAEWPTLTLNVVYADVGNTVGWQLAGHVPRRRKGWGTIPLPGWDPEVGWRDGPVPFDELPHQQDPPGGFVVTANNRPLPESEGHFLGVDWIDGYRQAALGAALADRADWDVPATQALQTDQQSLPWREMRDVVLAAPDDDPAARRALELLHEWDGHVAADSPAATVYELFLAEMTTRLARAKAPRSYAWALGRGFTLLAPHTLFALRRVGHLVRLLREQPKGWFPRPWHHEIADVLAAVVRRLEGTHGPGAAPWAWGRVRPLTLRHPLDRRPVLARIFNLGPVPCGGDSTTTAQASVSLLDPTANAHQIASLRMVIDVGAWGRSRFVLPGGQSGNPLSPHYADQLPLWQRGEGVPIAWTEDEVRQATRHTLRLLPISPPVGTQIGDPHARWPSCCIRAKRQQNS